MGRRPVSVSSRPEERSLLSISWPSVHPLERTLFSFRASALPVWPIVLRCPRCSQLHHQAFGQGQGTQVRACSWSQVIQRIQEVDHTITSVYLLTRLGICRYQASSVSVKRGGVVWKKKKKKKKKVLALIPLL